MEEVAALLLELQLLMLFESHNFRSNLMNSVMNYKISVALAPAHRIRFALLRINHHQLNKNFGMREVEAEVEVFLVE